LKVREAAVAAEGDEVELACLLSSYEARWHEGILSGSRVRANDPIMSRYDCAMNGAPEVWVGFYVWATRPPDFFLRSESDVGHPSAVL
jgi:hypothetical protein